MPTPPKVVHHPRSERWWRPLILVWLLVLVAIRGVAARRHSATDSRLFASRVAATLGSTPTELVFVDLRPRFGLRMYLGCEVEGVPLVPGENGRGLVQELAEAEPDEGRVFAIETGRLTEVESTVGSPFMILGNTDDLSFVKFPVPAETAPP